MLQIALDGDNGYRNKITLRKSGLRRFTPLIPKVISINQQLSKERRRVEEFIESRYEESFGARIKQHYPILMSVHDEQGNILAALGFRLAQHDTLFLEHYFDNSIEEQLSCQLQQTVARKDIVEIGNLASTKTGASIFLFIALNAWLEQQGFSFATITATHQLKRFFTTLKLDFIELVEADPARLANQAQHWGTYYSTQPSVLAGSISQTQSRMNKVLGFHLSEEPVCMFTRLFHR